MELKFKRKKIQKKNERVSGITFFINTFGIYHTYILSVSHVGMICITSGVHSDGGKRTVYRKTEASGTHHG